MLVIEGLTEAREQEAKNQNEAWLGISNDICGVEVYQFTPRHLLLLTTCGNCFVSASPISPAGVAQFLWVVSPEFSTVGAERDTFIKRVSKLPYMELVEEIHAYLSLTFQDSPASSGGPDKAQLASFVAYFVHIFASEYGWSIDQITNTPLRQLYQLLDIKNSESPNFIKIRPSDKLISDFLKKANE